MESRTNKTLKNAKVALFFYVANLLLSFISRRIFISYLGSEILGLNTTIVNLLSFLNLAELGIGAAVSYALYGPLFANDKRTINEIVSLQGWLYRKIGFLVIGGAGILMLFFPLMFSNISFPLWYTYASLIVLLISSLLGYFVNYQQIVLNADQKEYKITFAIQGCRIVKVCLQILFVYYSDHGYIYWLLIEFIMAFVTSFGLNLIIRKEYPWLKGIPSSGKKLSKKYPGIIIRTKQLFFHKFSGFVLTQTSPLILYAYTSLTLVAIYGNYMLIVTGVSFLLNAILNSVGAGVGNLVAENDMEKIMRIFWEINSFRIWIASVCCFCMYELSNSFVCLWVGEEYLLSNATLIILIIYAFITLTRTCDIFLGAYGLYHDIYAPIIEACLNIGCSIFLGYYCGITGIVGGVVISLVVVVTIWKPYFLFKRGFKQKVYTYFSVYIKLILLITLSFIISMFLGDYVYKDFCVIGVFSWCKYALRVLLVYALVSISFFYCFDIGMRTFLCRVKRIFL
ncbi:lipopolysaccharide biosynthesis protein [Bacteroides fragilis]|uniref:lipopolysaccharide biosynthesis protein n=1 Tax=Bacteroides fragilis TaxID=817 RepID=UPI002458F966|nr:sugar transporter [Bacteroides fragilis]